MTKFKKGESGNPNGRAIGSKNKKTLVCEALRQNSFMFGVKGEIDSLVNLIILADIDTSRKAELELITRIRSFRKKGV